MEFTPLPPRAEPAAQAAAPAQRQAPDAVSSVPETTRPVVAAEKSEPTSDAAQERFQPLDIYEVGDNDRMPVPPEPPRQSTVLAVMADAPPLEDTAEPPAKPIEQALQAIDQGPSNPTVDIRR